MPRYAVDTAVSSERSRSEIERTLQRYGANGFLYSWQASSAVIMFKMHGKTVRFTLPLPKKSDPAFHQTPTGRIRRNGADIDKCWEQACRQRWRALALAVKAKLEAVESKITVFEQEFLAHLVLPDGSTVGDFVIPRMEKALSQGKMLELPASTIDVEIV